MTSQSSNNCVPCQSTGLYHLRNDPLRDKDIDMETGTETAIEAETSVDTVLRIDIHSLVEV